MEYNVLEVKSTGFYGKEYILEVKESKDGDSKVAFVSHNVFERFIHTLFSFGKGYFSGVAGKGVGDLDETDIIRIVTKLNNEPKYSVSLEKIKEVSQKICQAQKTAVENEMNQNNNYRYFSDKTDSINFEVSVTDYFDKFNDCTKAQFDQILNYMLLYSQIHSYYGGSNHIYYIDGLNPEMSTCAEDVFKQFIDSFKK